MAEPTSCCAEPGGYCARVDALFNLPCVHVLDVTWHEPVNRFPASLRLTVETGRAGSGCPGCGVIAEPRGRRVPAGVGTATLDPFRGYGNAIRDELEDATAVLDAFHIVRLGMNAMEECRRRVQQEQLGHRGRKHDRSTASTTRCGRARPAHRSPDRTHRRGAANRRPGLEVTVAWRCYQQLPSAFHTPSLPDGRAIALRVLESFPTARSPRSPASAVPCEPGRSSS